MLKKKVCLRQLQTSILSGLKSRQNSLRLPEKPASISNILSLWSRVFCSDSNQNEIMELTGHSNTLRVSLSPITPRLDHLVARKQAQGLPLILHYGELYNYFIIYCNVIIIEIKCTVNVMRLNHPETIPPHPGPWKNCLPWNPSLVPKRLGTADTDA